MIKRTEAIVLDNKTYLEADLIVTYFTRKFGILKVFAKSPRKLKSRFGSSLEPFTYSNISFLGKEGTNLPKLTQSDIILPLQSLREDFFIFKKNYELIELCLRFIPYNAPNEEIFLLLLNTLISIDITGDSDLWRLYYKLKFLNITGLLPSLESCLKCGISVGENNIKKYIFSISEGAVFCNKCINQQSNLVAISDSSLKFFNSLMRWNSQTIKRIKAPEKLIWELTRLVNDHIENIIGMRYPLSS
ncbi:MAG: DNA repair protein RecO [Thermodesulfovibrionales bacterium]|nr:DNA repair protein RecO [Thermodesulfovibrionales bacterium]